MVPKISGIKNFEEIGLIKNNKKSQHRRNRIDGLKIVRKTITVINCFVNYDGKNSFTESLY